MTQRHEQEGPVTGAILESGHHAQGSHSDIGAFAF